MVKTYKPVAKYWHEGPDFVETIETSYKNEENGWRFDIWPEMQQDDEGDYVSFEDYNRLELFVKVLNIRLKKLQGVIK